MRRTAPLSRYRHNCTQAGIVWNHPAWCASNRRRPLWRTPQCPRERRLLGFTRCPGSGVIKSSGSGVVNIYCRRVRAVGDDQEVQQMEEGYTQLGTVLTDQRPENSEGDGVIVVGRFKGDSYDGVQLSYDAGRRNLY
jgi:hypothetical protein